MTRERFQQIPQDTEVFLTLWSGVEVRGYRLISWLMVRGQSYGVRAFAGWRHIPRGYETH